MNHAIVTTPDTTRALSILKEFLQGAYANATCKSYVNALNRTREWLADNGYQHRTDIALAEYLKALYEAGKAYSSALEVSDIEELSDGSGTVTIRKSTTDQIAEGRSLYLGRPTMKAIRE